MRNKFAISVSVLTITLAIVTGASAQWVQTNGPYGADISSFALIGPNLFVGTDDGVFRSTNGGSTWSPMSNGLAIPNVTSLAVIGNILFAASGYEEGIYRSTDNGNSWTAVNNGLPTNPTALSLAVSGPNILAVTYDSGIFLSTNNGDDWKLITRLASVGGSPLAVNGNHILAIAWDSTFSSTDNGISWMGTPDFLDDTARVSEINTFEEISNNVFAGTYKGVFRSTDSGITWLAANNGLTGSALYVYAFAVSDTTLFAATGDGVFRSIDNGANWTPVNSGLITSNSIGALLAIGKNLFAGTDGNGVFHSINDGITWTASNTGFPYLTVSSLAEKGTNLFAGTNGAGVFRSTDSGANWMVAGYGLTNSHVNKLVVSGPYLFAGTSHGIFRSTDSGESWTLSTNEVCTELTTFGLNGTNLLSAGYGIFISTDSGTTWTQEGNGPLDNIGINALMMSGTNLFDAGVGGVDISTDRGVSWSQTSLSNPGIASPDYDAFTTIGSKLFVGGSSIHFTTNNGINWIESSNGITGDALIITFEQVGSILFAGTNDGILLSTDTGASWMPENTGLPLNMFDNTFTSIGTEPSSAILFVGTSQGVWRRPLSDFGFSSVSTQPTSANTSLTAYPNPFTHSTTLRFISPESGYATVTIVNQLGEEVARVFEGELSAGEHSFQWNADGTSAPRGAYECVVRMNGQVQRVGIVVQ